jgi:2,4-dienoyl-CoA reductase-like NADH-dependent reductase (Old Yellow Enzyme family)
MTSPIAALFQPLQLQQLALKNRVVVSPMCQYSAHAGVPNDWHFVHLGRFALGGAGLVFVEATAVEADGRISYADTGLYTDEQQAAFARIVKFLHGQGAAAGIQLAHAGRKASTQPPWKGGGAVPAEGAAPGTEPWTPVAPSALAFSEKYAMPRELAPADLAGLKQAFARATERALRADFDVLEVHTAHGYLLTEFLSPLSNLRNDEYGGSRENRMRFPLEVVETVRAHWPRERPLFVRISTVDGSEGGWSLEDSVVYARELKARGVDVIDCSAGGLTPSTATLPDPSRPGYQVPFAERIKRDADVLTMAVGRITEAHQADAIIQSGAADLVALARAMLDDPNWALHAREQLMPESLGDAAYPTAVGYAVKALKRPPRPAK